LKEPELVTATQEELDEILLRARPALSDQQYRLLEGVLATFVYVMLKLQNAKTSIKRFQRMLFGHRTEHKRNVLEHVVAQDAYGQDAAGAGAEVAQGVVPVPKPRLPGHGRNAAQAYSGAPIVECDHPDLEPGDRCPQCDKGRVYDSPPRSIVKVVGQAPLGATVYRVQRLRCRLCDTVFTAPLPAAVASLPKYDSSCASMIAVLRYGHGLPNFRLEGLQASLYIPLPDATQWDIVSKAAPSPRAVFEELIRQAAQAPLLHSDDTPMKVLSLMRERERAEAGGVKPAAKAINTSGIVAVLPDNANGQRKVVLFFTGHAHAGKNMAARARAPGPGTGPGDADVRRAGGQRRRGIQDRPGELPDPRAAPDSRCRRAIPRGRPPRHRGPGRGLQA
jgi:transposase